MSFDPEAVVPDDDFTMAPRQASVTVCRSELDATMIHVEFIRSCLSHYIRGLLSVQKQHPNIKSVTCVVLRSCLPPREAVQGQGEFPAEKTEKEGKILYVGLPAVFPRLHMADTVALLKICQCDAAAMHPA